MRNHTTLAQLSVLTILVLFLPQAAIAIDKCRGLVGLSDTSLALMPGTREPGGEGVPEHCRVYGVINEHIEFELRLPDNWSGRLLMRGTGGYSGYIGDTTQGLEEGFAVVSTDTGHKGATGDFLADPKLAMDYIHRAVHLTTQASKRIARAYYERDVDHSYFSGCSNGGRQALTAALWYPDDFDGIVAGAPGIELTRALYWIAWAQGALARNPIDAGKLALIDDATRAACDALDGVEDGIINDPRACTDEHFTPQDLVCQSARDDTRDCLTEAEAGTLEKLYGGPVLADGTRLSWGLAKGAENAGDWQFWLFGDASQGTPPMNEQMGRGGLARVMGGADIDFASFDLASHWRRIEEAARSRDVYDTDLSAFHRSGGKLVIYQGWNDAIVRPMVPIEFVEEVRRDMGAVDDFLRLYMMPGVAHCGRGPGPDRAPFLDAVVAWVESGERPGELVATKYAETGEVLMTRPLCPHPKVVEYRGRGSTREAHNFQCR